MVLSRKIKISSSGKFHIYSRTMLAYLFHLVRTEKMDKTLNRPNWDVIAELMEENDISDIVQQKEISL